MAQATRRSKKKRKLVRFEYDTSSPRPVQAASLALVLMRYLQVNSMTEFLDLARLSPERAEHTTKTFVERLATLNLDDESQSLLNEHMPLLSRMRIKPQVTLGICPECLQRSPGHGWQLVRTAAPSKCRMTAGCEGAPIRVTAAKKVEVVTDHEWNVLVEEPDEALVEEDQMLLDTIDEPRQEVLVDLDF